MDCEVFGKGSAICGNFAELSDKKPEPFDYDRTAKWTEPYSFEWRETLGNAIVPEVAVEIMRSIAN